MKLTSLLLLLATLQISAKTYSQRLSVNFNNTKLVDALKQIEKQTDYRFVFSNKVLSEKFAVSVSAKNITIDSLLDKMLANTGLKDSVLENNLIVIKQVSEQVTLIKVSGTVKDQDGKPVAGATIKVKGKNTGTASDEKGNFTIYAEENETLDISSVGFAGQTIAVNGRTVIDIILQKSESKLDDVVVVGYGKQSRREITSAVTTLKTDQFKDAPYTDIQSAIAGRAAGVIVNFSGGEPGSVPQLMIRGGEPLVKQTAPLYVIDGIIRDQTTFVNLNVNDIENISFLKDAAATAVYGSKAAAGIVLVTTKKGVSGKPLITYSNNLAWNTPINFPKLIGAYDKALVANAMGEADGNGKYSAYSQGQLDTIKNNLNPSLYPNTDWYKLSFRKYAFQQSHNLSLSGGNDQTKYYLGLGYFGQGSNYVNNSFRVNRFSYNSRVSSSFDDIGLNVALALNGYYNYSTQPPAGSWAIFSHIVAASPFNKAYNSDGTLSAMGDHPLADIESPGYSRNETFFNDANLTFSWAVPWVKGLNFRVMGDYSLNSNPTKNFNVSAPQYNADGTIYPTPLPSLTETNGYNRAYNAEFQADYTHSFDKHHLGATFVTIVRGGYNSWLSAFRNNFPSTAIGQLFAGDASTQTNTDSAAKWGEEGFVGRLKYDYAGKYLLELNGRYDGSDYFPPGKRFGFFPSVSAGWIISSEQFYGNAKNVFSYLKLRASYGQVGSIPGNQFAKYAYVPQYNVNSQAYVVNGNLQNGYYEGPLTVADQNLTWYSTTSRDIGLDFEALHKKLSGSIDYFYTRTKNILGNPAYSYTEPLGQALPLVLTDAATRKEGIEASFNYNWTIGKVNGYIGFNFTYYRYIWEKTNEDSATLTNPYTRAWGRTQDYYDANSATGGNTSAIYNSLGLYQSYNDILNNPSRVGSTALSLGDVWLQDMNGDGKIDQQDYRLLGQAQNPRFTYGIPFGVEYKGIRFDALLQGAGSRDVYIGSLLQGGQGINRVNFDFQKDFWLSSNPNASFPRAGNSSLNNNNNYVASTFWLKNAEFLRLKSVTLSYSLKRVIKTKTFSDLSVHVSGTNLLTFSPVKKYFDPELADINNFFYPVNRTYSFGIRASF